MHHLQKIALIGCGSIARTHAKAIGKLDDMAELVYCVDIDSDKAAQFAEENSCKAVSLEDVLNDPEIDAVSICSSSGSHMELAVAAMESGKHVLLEKPMEVSSGKCDAILKAEAKSGKILTIISQHRFDPASEEVHKLVQDGSLGRIFGCDMQIPWYRTQEYYDEADWRGTLELDGGCLRNQGIHSLDLMLWLVGNVSRVWALTRTAAHERIEAADHLCATMECESGTICNLTCSTAVYPGFPSKLCVYGTNGTAIIEADGIHTIAIRGQEIISGKGHEGAMDIATGGTSAATQNAESQGDESSWKWGDAHLAQFRDFLECCQTGRKPRVTGKDGKAALALIEAIHKAADTGNMTAVTAGN